MVVMLKALSLIPTWMWVAILVAGVDLGSACLVAAVGVHVGEGSDPTNLLWLAVLVVGIFTSVLGLVITNAVTVRRSHNGIRLWGEVLSGNQLTYLAFFFARFAAFDLKEIYKNLCIIVSLLSLVFFVLGLVNNRTHEQLVLGAGHAKCDENCQAALNASLRSRILGANPALAFVH
jgi:hypothetical protein